MRADFSLAIVGLVLCCATNCGSFFVGGAITSGTAAIHGSITNVQLGTAGNGFGRAATQVTFVTFFQGSTFTTLGFCNNQIGQFPLNQMVNVNFTPGQSCATLVLVVLISG